jgi:predicted DNA-binding protein (UPF0251 family)
MPRPKKCRRIQTQPDVSFFKPQGIPLRALHQVELGFDELEALRLADMENLSQEEAAKLMEVSRATFGRIVSQARQKVADALVNGKAIQIEGGTVTFRPPGSPCGRGHGPQRHGKGPWR